MPKTFKINKIIYKIDKKPTIPEYSKALNKKL